MDSRIELLIIAGRVEEDMRRAAEERDARVAQRTREAALEPPSGRSWRSAQRAIMAVRIHR